MPSSDYAQPDVASVAHASVYRTFQRPTRAARAVQAVCAAVSGGCCKHTRPASPDGRVLYVTCPTRGADESYMVSLLSDASPGLDTLASGARPAAPRSVHVFDPEGLEVLRATLPGPQPGPALGPRQRRALSMIGLDPRVEPCLRLCLQTIGVSQAVFAVDGRLHVLHCVPLRERDSDRVVGAIWKLKPTRRGLEELLQDDVAVPKMVIDYDRQLYRVNGAWLASVQGLSGGTTFGEDCVLLVDKASGNLLSVGQAFRVPEAFLAGGACARNLVSGSVHFEQRLQPWLSTILAELLKSADSVWRAGPCSTIVTQPEHTVVMLTLRVQSDAAGAEFDGILVRLHHSQPAAPELDKLLRACIVTQ